MIAKCGGKFTSIINFTFKNVKFSSNWDWGLGLGTREWGEGNGERGMGNGE